MSLLNLFTATNNKYISQLQLKQHMFNKCPTSDSNIVIVDAATLIVTDVTSEEVFTCRATNVLGTTEAKFVVKTIDRYTP